MTRLPWRRGPAAFSGTVFVSATRFTYRRRRHMPLVFVHGMLLRSRWGNVEGAVGMFTGANALARTTYTVSVWRSEEDLRRWLGSPRHARLMREYRPYLESSYGEGWLARPIDAETIWSEAISRLREERARRGRVTPDAPAHGERLRD